MIRSAETASNGKLSRRETTAAAEKQQQQQQQRSGVDEQLQRTIWDPMDFNSHAGELMSRSS
jgi:hypothetical protein